MSSNSLLTMMFQIKQKVTRTMSLLVVAAFVLAPNLFSIQAESLPNKFDDNFRQTYLKPDHRANWWIINWGPDENGQQGIWEDYCGSSSCFIQVSDESESYGRLRTYPGNIPGVFTNVDVAEEHTGYPAEINNEWEPTVDKPVEMVTTVRWSETFNQTATAGAKGTSGVWMWNSPYDVNNYDPEAPITGFGFNYAEANTLGGWMDGLKLNLIYQTYPMFVADLPMQIDMQEWNTFRFLWSVDANGVETIEAWVNDVPAAEFVLPVKLGKMSTEIWHDNEHAVFNESGFAILYSSFETQQDFDIKYYSVRHLQTQATE